MSGFTFDAKAALKRARQTRGHPNPPNRPNPEPTTVAGLGRLGRLGRERASSEEPAEPIAQSLTDFAGYHPAPAAANPPGPLQAVTAREVAKASGVETPSAHDVDDPWRHGASVTGRPRTWTGRIVSLDAWRTLTEWERHGPNGRQWNGITQRWE